MRKTLYFVYFLVLLGVPSHAISETLYYEGIMNVRDSKNPAHATYEKVDYLKDPIIKITYEISGEKYLTRYFSDFGDKHYFSNDVLTVYNDIDNKKQNYHFEGKKTSLIKSLLPWN